MIENTRIDKPLDMDQLSQQELDRAITRDTDRPEDLTESALIRRGPQGTRRCAPSERELLNNRFDVG